MVSIEAQIPYADHEAFVTKDLYGFEGDVVASIERFPSIGVRNVIEQNKASMRDELHELGSQELYERLEKAGERFAQDSVGPNEISREEYVKQVCRITGLPVSSVDNSVNIIEYSLTHMESILTHYVPNGDISVFDENRYRSQNGSSVLHWIISKFSDTRAFQPVTVGYVPKGQNLGVISPGNHPAVMTLALIAYGAKYPLAVRPSDGEPFTAARVIAALRDVGLPEASLVLLPGDREISNKVLSESDLGIGFGGPQLQKRYAEAQSVKIHGPGNSKVVIDSGWEDDINVYELLEDAMLRDGGRGCINMSQIVTTGDAVTVASRLAERVADIPVKSPLNTDAKIPAVVNEKQAHQLNEQIECQLQQTDATDVTAAHRDGDRLVTKDGITYLRPTVIELSEGYENWLFRELPFQYATVVGVPQERLQSIVADSLTVSAFTNDDALVDNLLLEPSIEKVYAGDATCDMDLREPHEGYVTDFLFKRKAYRPA